MTDDNLEALRAAVARHTGPARAQPLIRLGQALVQRYWQIGPGSPAGRPHLDEAITALGEAHGLLEAGQFPRGMQAGILGWLLGIRHVVHGTADDDRERGIVLLDEALTFPQAPAMMRIVARLVLGQLLISRVTAGMRSPDAAMRLMGSGLSGADRASADRAVACFREVLDAPEANAEIRSMAETMLGMAEALQNMAGGLGGGMSGGLGGLDLGRMMQALAGLQKLQQQAAQTQRGAGFGRIPNLFDFVADDVAALDPLQRPVTVIEGAVPPAAAPPRERPAARPTEPAATFRDALLEKLPGGDVAGLGRLLDDSAAPPPVDTVDDLVALGSALTDAPDAVGTDHLLLAGALYLRSLVDSGGGWGDDDDTDDVRAAAQSLLVAADALGAEPADVVAVAFRLATLLDARDPAREVRTRLAEGFADVVKALRGLGADGLLYTTAGSTLLLDAGTGRFGPAADLPRRLLVAGDGPLPDGPVVSLVRSAAQVVELAARTRRPLAEAAVFVANPRGDRQQASMDAMVLRRRFYPGSAGLGRTVEDVRGAGTADEVHARLDASLLHLGCGVTADGGLELAGSDVLERDPIAAGPASATGGLAVLPPAGAGARPLADALLASRFTGVIRFRETVPDDVASIVHLVLHAELVDARRDPADAVAAVRRWLADPHRTPPEYLPPWLEARAGDADLAGFRDALVHHGI